ncbi:MAG TPA: hypothetical protein GXX31_06665 [Methanothermobacter sp.]|uniref:Uncharacterized protein n=1 Tax=Methanothermobacter tenebrarum TaxID=680118 RepID=A0ABM7YC35_9EURY|nr:hypothetical protein [Methanothermobacter tenebrarum]MDD3455190.1 hypothetical protein [Methanobacteriales archaeon]MDI6882348.1 hypothetical protein [Methanothermobacter sp.]MDX9694120.1 hypothetical protein [Methanothermobacter sp.]BDH78814.1 hypothetical protein MTTB_01930 [Methanothermobacter tenebrarum]HHW17024.1 hypothetical protein [Methanothermobacter sp.]
MKEELLKKCENIEDPDILNTCKVLLELMEKKKVKLEEKEESYLEMAERIKPSDVPRVLELALRIRESKDIKDPEIKNTASRLIRAIEMS